MASEGFSASSVRTKFSTGYGRLDEALQGGFLAGSMVVLNAPAIDEIPILLRSFLKSNQESSLLICRNLSSTQTIAQNAADALKCLVCSDKPVSPAQNILPGKGIENLTDLNLQITEALSSVQPTRVALDILSDVLLRHKALQTRKWLNELLERFRSKGITTLAILNPYMHANEEVQAVVDLFDGNIEIIEKDVEGTLRKFLRIKWMHDIEVAEKEFPLVGLTLEAQTPSQHASAQTAPLKEPRWLTPLISRTEELFKLKAAFENSRANRGSVVALQGEAGAGKTRLMQELAIYAQSKNAIALTGSASEDGLPYAPWIEITRQYMAQAPGELLRRMLGPNASELVKLVPDIAAKLGTIPPSKTIGEQQEKIRFYEAVTQFFIAICKDKPLVLLFDDMQYVDQSSLDLLEYFVRSSSNLRVLTACSVPAEHELESDNPFEQTLMKFNKQRLLESVTVKNLDKESTATLIKQVFGEQTVSPEFSDVIYQRTGGNPFFIEEVLRSLVEDGTIFRTEKGWDRKPIQEVKIPKSVKNTLKSRLAKLDAQTLDVLTIASVMGSEFEFAGLQEISQLSEDTLLGETEKALRGGLLVEVPRQLNRFKFADDRIRQLLLDDLSGMRRAKYHFKIAEALEKQYAKNLQSHAEVLANHFSMGGDAKRGAKYLIMAGDRNRVIHAYEQAAKDYKAALDLTDLEEGKDEEKALILEKLADSYLDAGKLQDSTRTYHEALEMFEKLHDFKACARACAGLGSAEHEAKGYAGMRETVTIFQRGLKYVEREPESSEAATIYSLLASYTSVLDEWEEANAWAEKASEVGERTHNYGAVASGLAVKGSFLTDHGKIDEGLPFWEKAVDVALQHDEYQWAFFALLNLVVYTLPRNLAKAREIAQRWLHLTQRVNDIYFEAGAWNYLSLIDWLRGDWNTALEEHEKRIDIRERLGPVENIDRVGRGRIFLGMGELEKAESDLWHSLQLVKPDSKITEIVEANLAYGLLRLEQGNEGDARRHFEICVDAFTKMEFTTLPLLHIETLLGLTSLYGKEGQVAEARKLSEWARRLAETLKSDAGLAMALQAEATLLSATGDRKGAEEAYLESLGLWEKANWPYYHAKALVAYAEAIAHTNTEESKKRFQQAAEVFRKLGAKRDLEKAQTKLSA